MDDEAICCIQGCGSGYFSNASASTHIACASTNKKRPLTIFFNFCGFVACLLLHFIILRKQKPSFIAITLPTSLELIISNYSVFVFLRYQNLDDGYFTCCIFLDLSKAFDTVNHRILLDKLYSYGIRGNMHKLLTSYLQNRKQFTVCNNIKSQINTIVCGVPQGSTLGPLLFSLYVNDLPLHTKFHVNLFADDTVLILKNKNHINL